MRKPQIHLCITVCIIASLFITSPVSAHGIEIHEKTKFIIWVVRFLIVLSSAITIGTWTKFLYSGFMKQEYDHMLRAATVLISFLFWFLLIGVQNYILSIGNNTAIYNISFYTGYFVLPFTLLSLWRVIRPFAKKHLSYILKINFYRRVFVFSIIGYSAFYLLTSGMIIPPDSEGPTISKAGFFGVYESYGPLTFWPNIEFIPPLIGVFAAISIGTLLMMLTLSGLMAIGIVLFVYSLKVKQQNKLYFRSLGNLTGSSVSLTLTSFCCCCLPVLAPVLSLLIGTAAAETLSLLLVSSSSPLFNMIQTAVLSLMALSVISLSKNIDILNSGQCEI